MKLQPVIDAKTLIKNGFKIFLFSLRYYFEIETFYTCTMVTLNFDQIQLLLYVHLNIWLWYVSLNGMCVQGRLRSV